MDKVTVRNIILSKTRIPMSTFRTIRYFSMQIGMLAFAIFIFIITWTKYSACEMPKASIIFLFILVCFSLLTALLQFIDLKFTKIATDNSDSVNFKILKRIFEENGFEMDIQNRHCFKVSKKYRTCVFYFFLIDGKICFAYTFDLEMDWAVRDHPIPYLLINPFKRRFWKDKITSATHRKKD
ncbi:hypothetical protein [Marinifilum flexuosum]|uniref:hypothetical protein n=1 Tax=Marinifilum flexuosum TaxID=1117708 RepID=UPI0024931593|nr:hypothetical protein [Marinifilum flexuosum]